MRLAILIVGAQNSGKTTTIKHLIRSYNGRTLKVMKAGWKDIFLNPLFKSLKLNFYCIPASPTETDFKLSLRCANWFPEVMVIAEQTSGANYADTINFLITNGYTILRYDIINSNGTLDWERFNSSDMNLKLDNRANQIVVEIKNFLKSNGII